MTVAPLHFSGARQLKQEQRNPSGYQMCSLLTGCEPWRVSHPHINTYVLLHIHPGQHPGSKTGHQNVAHLYSSCHRPHIQQCISFKILLTRGVPAHQRLFGLDPRLWSFDVLSCCRCAAWMAIIDVQYMLNLPNFIFKVLQPINTFFLLL